MRCVDDCVFNTRTRRHFDRHSFQGEIGDATLYFVFDELGCALSRPADRFGLQPPPQPRFQFRYKPLPSCRPPRPGVKTEPRQHLRIVPFRQPCRPLLRPPRTPLRHSRQQRVFPQPAMRRRAAPGILLRPAHDPRPHRIPFHILDRRPQMLLIQRAGAKTGFLCLKA